MTFSDSLRTSESELSTRGYLSFTSSESSVVSDTSNYTKMATSTSANPRKRSFDSAFLELEPAQVWAGQWPTSDFILPLVESDAWGKDLCASLGDIALCKSFTEASILGSPSVVQADQLSTTDAPQDSSDQLHPPKEQQTEMPTAITSQEVSSSAHPIVRQAIVWGTTKTSRKDILQLSAHLANCSCWKGLECHFTREQRYFPQWNKDEGDKKLVIMRDGRPCIVVATIWMPIHLLHPTKRNMEYEKSLRKAPRSTILAFYEMLLNELELCHDQVEVGMERFREMQFAARRAVEVPRGYHVHLAWRTHLRFKIEWSDIFQCGSSEASRAPATSTQQPRTPGRGMKVLVTLHEAIALEQQAVRYIRGVKVNMRGIESLAIMCEELLSNSCWNAPAVLPTIPVREIRWNNKKRGWTGLKPEDIVV